jgi:hypothetical protein
VTVELYIFLSTSPSFSLYYICISIKQIGFDFLFIHQMLFDMHIRILSGTVLLWYPTLFDVYSIRLTFPTSSSSSFQFVLKTNKMEKVYFWHWYMSGRCDIDIIIKTYLMYNNTQKCLSKLGYFYTHPIAPHLSCFNSRSSVSRMLSSEYRPMGELNCLFTSRFWVVAILICNVRFYLALISGFPNFTSQSSFRIWKQKRIIHGN